MSLSGLVPESALNGACSMNNIGEARAFACRKVWEQNAPILHVLHETDGDWQFLCGDDHPSADEAVLLHAQHVFDRFPDMAAVSDIRPGFYRWRNAPDQAWKEYRIPD